MRAVDLIEKKRDGKVLEDKEIEYLLNGYLDKSIPDYQMASFLMATYFNGMAVDELRKFTEVMINSGETISFPNKKRFLIDKHSTGGVGDKTTIALAGLFEAFGIGTAKLSGRGLGHTGGTIDKFESIKGFTFPQTKEGMEEKINETGTGIMGSSDKIVPLDKKIYALRDVTSTVMSIPLIASSIMSKKLAVEADGIILDVKVGSGAFMKDIKKAKELSKTLLEIGGAFNRKVVTILTNMDEPLGYAVGNSLEIVEAIETLKGNGPRDFNELLMGIVGMALVVKGDAKDLDEGKKMVEKALKEGEGVSHLKEFLRSYGGDEGLVDDYSKLPQAKNKFEVVAKKDGYIKKIEAEDIGKSAMVLGAGRATKEDEIDHSVGIILSKKVGEKVKKGEKLATIYYNDSRNLEVSKEYIESGFKVVDEEVEVNKTILFIDSINL